MCVISVQNICKNSRVHRCETIIRLYAFWFPHAKHIVFFKKNSRCCYGGILGRRGYIIIIEVVSRLHSVLNACISRSHGYSSSYINRATSVCTQNSWFLMFFLISVQRIDTLLAPIMCIMRHRTCTQLCRMAKHAIAMVRETGFGNLIIRYSSYRPPKHSTFYEERKENIENEWFLCIYCSPPLLSKPRSPSPFSHLLQTCFKQATRCSLPV